MVESVNIFTGYGMEPPCGHIDFYPNGGFDQPGCSLFDMPVSLDSMVTGPDSTATMDTMGRHLVACSHNRGIDLYIESLRSTSCQMVSHRCDSYEYFLKVDVLLSLYCRENDIRITAL